MPSEKVVGIFDHLGIDLPNGEVKHYGVKGMKWGKNRTPEEIEADAEKAREAAAAAGGGEMDQDFAEAQARGIPVQIKKNDKAFFDGRSSVRKNGKLIGVARVRGNSEMRQLVDKLFDSRQSVRGPVTRVRQGVINKFIEDAFKKVTGK